MLGGRDGADGRENRRRGTAVRHGADMRCCHATMLTGGVGIAEGQVPSKFTASESEILNIFFKTLQAKFLKDPY